jgi:hypothetical protein
MIVKHLDFVAQNAISISKQNITQEDLPGQKLLEN